MANPKRRNVWLIALAVLASSAAPAWAGPPFLTDDPEPTDVGHWELYGPLLEIEGRGTEFEGAAGVEINYGAASDLQLTIGIPVSFAHDSTGWRSGAGDVEVSAKYRIYHNRDAGISIAAFPGLTLPTASNGMGSGKVTALLPIWVQRDSGPWSVFGGGGYAINTGAASRNYWTGSIAVTRKVNSRWMIGIEASRQGADSVGGNATTRLGLGTIYQLRGPFRVLASGGPTFTDGGRTTGFHGFLALGADF